MAGAARTLAWLSLEEKALSESPPAPVAADTASQVPKGRLGRLEVSRLIGGGRFDFQVAEDVQLVNSILPRHAPQDRPWHA